MVVDKLPNLPVYKVRPEKGRPIVKTLHRDHLLPIGHLVRLPDSPTETVKPQRPVTRSRQNRLTTDNSPQMVGPESLDASESEDEGLGGLTFAQQENIAQAVDLLAESFSNEIPHCDDVLESFSDVGDVEVEAQPVAGTGDELLLPDDPVVYMGLEEGELPSSSMSEGSSEQVDSHLPRREVKPVIRLSYDKPGQPTDRTIVVVHRGLRITISRG